MNADELRKIAEDAKHRQESERRRADELQEIRNREHWWTKAKKAVEELSQTLEQAAKMANGVPRCLGSEMIWVCGVIGKLVFGAREKNEFSYLNECPIMHSLFLTSIGDEPSILNGSAAAADRDITWVVRPHVL
jgi:hypothetical protein